MSEANTLRSAAVEVPFSEIDAALQRSQSAVQARWLTGTLVVVGFGERLREPAQVLPALGDRSAVRTILISLDPHPAPVANLAGNTIAIRGLKAGYVDNAVAALRLSSLPTLVWFRGGPVEMLSDLAELADRLVLDEEAPAESWRRALSLFERTAVSDLRWTRLTRWRALMAHFFDMPEVREAAQTFTRLNIQGEDRIAGALYASWLKTALSLRLEFEFEETKTGTPLSCVRFGNTTQHLELALVSSGTCVRTAAEIGGNLSITRIVSLGDQRLAALIAEELRIRARDQPFERAVSNFMEAS